MLEVKGNLFDQQGWLCITTNGFVKNNGRAVMGAGCAKTIRDEIPGIDLALGKAINQYGNVVRPIGSYRNNPVFSFPVKHNWWEHADTALIQKSAKELRDFWLYSLDGDIANAFDVWIPRPGCGNGRLKWETVKPILEKELLEPSFKIITF